MCVCMCEREGETERPCEVVVCKATKNTWEKDCKSATVKSSPGHPESQTLALFLPNPYSRLQFLIRSSLFVPWRSLCLESTVRPFFKTQLYLGKNPSFGQRFTLIDSFKFLLSPPAHKWDSVFTGLIQCTFILIVLFFLFSFLIFLLLFFDYLLSMGLHDLLDVSERVKCVEIQ